MDVAMESLRAPSVEGHRSCAIPSSNKPKHHGLPARNALLRVGLLRPLKKVPRVSDDALAEGQIRKATLELLKNAGIFTCVPWCAVAGGSPSRLLFESIETIFSEWPETTN